LEEGFAPHQMNNFGPPILVLSHTTHETNHTTLAPSELNMQKTQTAYLAFIGLVFVSGCETAPRETTTTASSIERPQPPRCQLPSLESHLEADWISKATRIQSGDSVVYYRGSAQRVSSVDEPWTGTVQGDILFLSPQRAVLIPSGTLRWKGATPSKFLDRIAPCWHARLPGGDTFT
jgi:hypothetical protein